MTAAAFRRSLVSREIYLSNIYNINGENKRSQFQRRISRRSCAHVEVAPRRLSLDVAFSEAPNDRSALARELLAREANALRSPRQRRGARDARRP